MDAQARLFGGRGASLVVGLAVLLLLSFGAARQAAAAPQGGWTWPLDVRTPVTVVRGFDPPATAYGAGHRGVDLAGMPGAPVLAAGSGRVSYAGLLAGRGVLVVVHGELRTTYEPVTATVSVGQPVEVGEPIGNLDAGHGGCPEAACLHWGLRRGETYLNPLSVVGAGPVRLLPLGGPLGTNGAASDRATGAGSPSRARDAPAAAGDAPAGDQRPAPASAAPDWDLRAAATPSGALAVVALVAGLALLIRRAPPTPEPPSAAGPAAVAGPDPSAGQDGALLTAPAPGRGPPDLVDLAAERSRRRAPA